MSANVEPEEAEAIRDLVQEEGEREDVAVAVEQRDFHQPRRFSENALRGFQRQLTLLLPELDSSLRSVFKVPVRTEVTEFTEMSAEGLFDGLEKPFAIGGFEINGQPAWITWDIRAVVQLVELLLGSEGEPEPRSLSTIENRLLADIFGVVVDVVARALSFEAANLRIETAVEDIANWTDPGDDAQSHRLCVALGFEGPGEASAFRLYLPGFDGLDAGPNEDAAIEVPPHAQDVKIEVGAYLGSSDVPLDSLLALEVGDIIALGTTLSDPVILRVEGQACGFAEMGAHDGNRAIRILELNPKLDGIS